MRQFTSVVHVNLQTDETLGKSQIRFWIVEQWMTCVEIDKIGLVVVDKFTSGPTWSLWHRCRCHILSTR